MNGDDLPALADFLRVKMRHSPVLGSASIHKVAEIDENLQAISASLRICFVSTAQAKTRQRCFGRGKAAGKGCFWKPLHKFRKSLDLKAGSTQE
jgi:hypothetical protein